ncbi:MAG: class I SAM-dependent methyltransferase [Deltaproteobacteria bacterium]|nr:class I SAM-dependent methyltransferase [Deltaproteobacteria bacterium]
METKDIQYTERLISMQYAFWKKLLYVQWPFKYNLSRLHLGYVLDVGCGIGRNLINLNGSGVGVDHNEHSVKICRQHRLLAYTPQEFLDSEYAHAGTFDSMLLSHVVEHIEEEPARGLIDTYCRYLKPGGKIVLITPQRAGFKSDSTHVRYVGFKEMGDLCACLNLKITRQYSFPFPAFVGDYFRYNEHVVIATAGGS